VGTVLEQPSFRLFIITALQYMLNGLGSSKVRVELQLPRVWTHSSPRKRRRVPAFIKFDIEGGGTDALPGCRQLFREARPFVLIESHMPEEDRAISNVLCEFNYCGYRLNNRKWVKKPDAIHPEEDGVWGTMLLVPSERYARVAALIGLERCPTDWHWRTIASIQAIDRPTSHPTRRPADLIKRRPGPGPQANDGRV
jgi:hypothetical protein